MHNTPKRAYNESRLEDAKRMLLEEYSHKTVRRLIQIDGHQVGLGDDVMCPDEDGHCLMGQTTYELRTIAGTPALPVRVELYEDGDKDEVVSLLRKITRWIEEDWDYLRTLGREQPALPLAVEETALPPAVEETEASRETPDNLILFPSGDRGG